MRAIAILTLASAAALPGQNVAPAYEAASVKPNTSDGRDSGTHSSPGQIRYDNMTLERLIEQAYGVMPPQVSGPDWLRDTRFDIAAKYPEGAAAADRPLMLRALLEDRFKLAIHREKRELNGYAMVLTKGGFKLHPVESTGSTTDHGVNGRTETLAAKGATMERLAALVSKYLDALVVDQTGIEGAFNFDLRWSREVLSADRPNGERPNGDRPGAERSSAEPAPAPSLFDALQQTLGVRLQAQKVSVDVVVVDHAERVPTGN